VEGRAQERTFGPAGARTLKCAAANSEPPSLFCSVLSPFSPAERLAARARVQAAPSRHSVASLATEDLYSARAEWATQTHGPASSVAFRLFKAASACNLARWFRSVAPTSSGGICFVPKIRPNPRQAASCGLCELFHSSSLANRSDKEFVQWRSLSLSFGRGRRLGAILNPGRDPQRCNTFNLPPENGRLPLCLCSRAPPQIKLTDTKSNTHIHTMDSELLEADQSKGD